MSYIKYNNAIYPKNIIIMDEHYIYVADVGNNFAGLLNTAFLKLDSKIW